MKKEQAHIVYLQETHSRDIEHRELKRIGFTKKKFSSYKLGHRRGVAILISNRLNFEKVFEMGST
jgi:exonuclease III